MDEGREGLVEPWKTQVAAGHIKDLSGRAIVTVVVTCPGGCGISHQMLGVALDAGIQVMAAALNGTEIRPVDEWNVPEP